MRSWVALAGLSLLPCGCAQLIGLDEFEEARLASGMASFDAYRFRAGAESFRVDAASGLLANDGDGSRVVSTGRRFTRRGGLVELAQDGSFTYEPPGPPGVFWGDDQLVFAVQRGRLQDDAAQARFTVQPFALDVTATPRVAGAGFGLLGGRNTFVGASAGAMASAGDFNGDGREDLLLGAPGSEALGLGVYVTLGKTNDAEVRLFDTPREPGLILLGAGQGDRLGGLSASGAGDVNGDGFDDLIIGAPSVVNVLDEAGMLVSVVPSTSAGRAYVLYGRRGGNVLTIDELIEDESEGFYIEGAGIDTFGLNVAGAGDVNGDGFDDLIVGAPYTSAPRPFSGAAYVIFGGPELRSFNVPDESGLDEPLDFGFVIRGARDTDFAGILVRGAGDVNGDGLDDVLVGSSVASSGLLELAGSAYIVHGKRDTSPVQLLDFDLDTPQGFKIIGAESADRIGTVAATGDMNGDGLSDVALGSAFAAVGASTATEQPPGAVYVVFGKSAPGNVSAAAIEQESGPGYTIIGAPPLRSAGSAMSSGDLDGDGLVDLLIGALPSAEQSKSYVVFGKRESRNVELASLEVGEPGGFSLFGQGGVVNGFGVIAGSDLNGDGLDDMVVGAGGVLDGAEEDGGAYAIFSWDMTGALGARRGALIGTLADDTLELPPQPLIAARGGRGTDTLRITGSGRVLDLRPSAPRFESIEVIDLSGDGANTLILDDSALRRTPASRPGLPFELARTLTVLSDGDDTLYFDLTGYQQAGAREGRLVYVREGAYYGFEISPGLRVAWPPP